MPKRRDQENLKRGYQLPTVIEPERYLCVCVPVPKDTNHIRAFLGQIDYLGYWWSWQRESLKQGTHAASVWRTVADIVRANVECAGEVSDLNNCCCGANPTNTRFLSDGTMQVSYDGGATWENAPAGVDPRYSGAVAPPLVGADGNTKRCNAAGSARMVMIDQQLQFANDAQMWSGITGAMAALVALLVFIGIIGSGGALTPLLLGLGAALLSAGHDAFVAAFNDSVWDTVQCAIYCHTKADGSPYAADDIAAIRADLSSQLTGVALTFIDKTLEVWGGTGLTNASRAGMISNFDCSTCACGSCNLSTWDIWPSAGTLISRTETQIEASAIDGGDGFFYLSLKSAGINECCCHLDFTADNEPTAIGYNPCTAAQDGTHLQYAYTGQAANAMVFKAPYAFTLTLFSTGDCP